MLKFELVIGVEQQVQPGEMEDACVNPQYPDLYMSNGTCYIWFQFEPDESYLGAWELYPTAISSLKKRHWLEREVHDNGLDLIFGPERCGLFGQWLNFALKEGLYLFQPFLVAFDQPDYYRCNHPLDPEEWDVNYSWEIVYRDEPTPEMVAETVKFLSEVLE